MALTEPMNIKTENEKSLDGKEYRFLVGNPDYFDYASAIQFNLLTTLGLREHHKILDIGCGSLRAGRLLIPYLRPGHYFGLEPHDWLIQEGISQELGQSAIDLKRPNFSHDTDFTLTTFGEKFDFLIAQSIFSHTPQSQMRRCFAEASKVMTPDSIFVASFFEGTDNFNGDRWIYAAEYTSERVQQLVEDAGLEFRAFEWPHQDGQKWFLVLHPENQIRIPDAADVQKIMQLESQIEQLQGRLLAIRSRWLVRTARKAKFFFMRFNLLRKFSPRTFLRFMKVRLGFYKNWLRNLIR